MNTIKDPLRTNIGFMLKGSSGQRRVIDYEFGAVVLDRDLALDMLSGRSEITRTRRGLMIETELETTITAECGRCLTEFPFKLKTRFSDLYVFSRKDRSEDELVLPDDGFIDLGPVAREQLLLEIPINLVCKADCDGLCAVCGANKNEEDCGHIEEDVDPRFASLRSLLKDS